MNPLRSATVLYVIGTLEVGGTELHLLTLTKGMVAEGYRVITFSLVLPGTLEADFKDAGVVVVGSPKSPSRNLIRRAVKNLKCAVLLFRTLRKTRPDIVHFFLPAAYLLGAPLALLTGCSIRVLSRRSLNLYQKKIPFASLGERLLHRSMTAILGNSKSVVHQLREEEGVPEQKLRLIHNGVSLTKFLPARKAIVRQNLSITDNALVMIMVANLIPYKGHRDLLDALNIAKDRLPNGWCLLIVGRDEGFGDELREKAEQYGLSENVRFLGPRNDVAELLQASDVSLLTSHEEGFSNAILEGMAAGLPMIVTDVGGNAEAVINDETGFVVQARNPENLAAAIVRIANDSELRSRFGRAGRIKVETEFSVEKCLDEYKALYTELLGNVAIARNLAPRLASRDDY